MTRENKQDYIAANIFEQVSEHLYDLSTFASNPKHQLELWIQSLMKECFEYVPENGYSILAHHSRTKKIPNLIVVKNNKPMLVVETRALGAGFEEGSEKNSDEYIQAIGKIPWKIMTNGYEWSLSDLKNGGVEILSFDLRDNDALDLTKSGISENCKSLAELHSYSYEKGLWEQYSLDALAITSEALMKAMLSADVVTFMSKHIRGDQYKVNPAVLIDRVYKLLHVQEETKPEMELHIKKQKRVGSRGKKKSLSTVTEELLLREIPSELVAPSSKKSNSKKSEEKERSSEFTPFNQ
jgi:hypothetical protein